MYENKVVAFIDILGFKEKIDESFQNGIENFAKTKLIYDFINQIHKDFDTKGEFTDTSNTIATQFSDSIVISFPYDTAGGVYNTLQNLMFLHSTALSYGFIIRGAISYGPIVHDKVGVFGPSLVNSYLLEAKTAFYPRIIMTEDILKLAELYPASQNLPKYEREYIRSIVKQDFDNYYYIDYIENAVNFLDDGEDFLPLYLQQIENIVNETCNKSNDPKVLNKMKWLKHKINETILNRKNYLLANEVSSDYDDLKYYYLTKQIYRIDEPLYV